jgi:hypothetical protein
MPPLLYRYRGHLEQTSLSVVPPVNKTVFVAELPDLISPDSYAGDPSGRQVKLRIRMTTDGIEILGDAVRPQEIEKILREVLGIQQIEQMLCG